MGRKDVQLTIGMAKGLPCYAACLHDSADCPSSRVFISAALSRRAPPLAVKWWCESPWFWPLTILTVLLVNLLLELRENHSDLDPHSGPHLCSERNKGHLCNSQRASKGHHCQTCGFKNGKFGHLQIRTPGPRGPWNPFSDFLLGFPGRGPLQPL